jgi:hypothetical protein
MEIFLRNINHNPNWNRSYITTANCVLVDTVQRFYEGFLFFTVKISHKSIRYVRLSSANFQESHKCSAAVYVDFS